MPKAIIKQPLWRGPDKDGITQSLLGKFLECRERFRLRVVEGLTEDEGFSRPLEFGNFWHTAEEAHLGGKQWEAAIKAYRLKLQRNYPDDETEISKWYNVCKTTFPIYLDYWSRHKDQKGSKPILEECSFAVPYVLPSGRNVLLRGKWDALRLLQIGKSKKLGIFIKEHKTKGEIDEDGILKTVAWNLQTMDYQIALRTLLDLCMQHTTDGILVNDWPDYGVPIDKLLTLLQHFRKGIKPAGVLYNVIRRPLASNYAIKQRKGRLVKGKLKGAESHDQFYKRLGADIRTDAKDYFMRWKVEVNDEDIERFKEHTFHPILEQLWDWWEWIRVDPFNPWQQRPLVSGSVSTYPIGNRSHYQSPWGVYNSLAGGFRGSYFEYLTSGRDYRLSRITTLFPELA